MRIYAHLHHFSPNPHPLGFRIGRGHGFHSARMHLTAGAGVCSIRRAARRPLARGQHNGEGVPQTGVCGCLLVGTTIGNGDRHVL